MFSIQFSVKKLHYIYYIDMVSYFDELLWHVAPNVPSIISRFTDVTRVCFFFDSGFLYPNFSFMNMLIVTVQYYWMNRRHLCSSTEEKKLLDEMNHMYLFVYCSRRLTQVAHIVICYCFSLKRFPPNLIFWRLKIRKLNLGLLMVIISDSMWL